MLSKDNVLEVEISKKVACSKEIAKWNYWDHEHLDVIHGGYESVDNLYDADNFCFTYTRVKIPVIPFLSSMTPLFLVQHDEFTQFTYAIQFGVVSRTTIKIEEITTNSCKITMNYKFHLNGWKKVLSPILKYLIPIWNKKVWIEDLPVKLRRQKVLEMGHKDFIGLPNSENDRKGHVIKKTKLPIPRPRNSSRDQHPLCKNKYYK
tara:strand:- start:28135 stop:28749 length:615 start_codon:yes stop_codon:yes gene_type:complete